MNEKIKELAKQANAWYPNGYPSAEGGDDAWKNLVIFEKEDLEKFAELIVRECLGCCEQVISDPVPENVDTWLNGGSQCIDEIKEHFRVEE